MSVRKINGVVIDADTLDGVHLADIPGATKEFYVHPSAVTGTTITPGATGTLWGMTAAGNEITANFVVPHDFNTLLSLKIVGKPAGTGTIDWTCNTGFRAAGESETQHTDSVTVDGEAMTDDVMKEIDLSDALTGLAAGDWVGIQFIYDAESGTTGFYVVGLVFKYI